MSDRRSDVRIAVARRDVASLSREKTIVLALLIQLFIAAFSSFLVVGLTSLYDPSSVETGGITVGVSGEAREDLRSAAREADVDVRTYPSRDRAVQAFRNPSQTGVQAVVHGDYAGGEIAVTASIPDSSIRSTVIVVRVRRLLETLERVERVERQQYLTARPAPMPPESNASPYFGFTYTVLLPLLLFLPPFISGSVTVDAITEEIERGTLELLRVAPVSLVDVVDGKALGMALLAPAQAILWILLLSANGISIANVVPLIALVSAAALLVVVLGTVLGLAMGERRQAQLLYSMLALAAFAAAAFLPEHPATVAAKLAVDSATTTTYVTVAGLAVLALGCFGVARRYVGRIDPERYS